MGGPVNYRQDNWFSRLLDRKGQDYIKNDLITVDEISKNAERIIDDIIKGKIDYQIYGYCIVNHKILNTLINYCTTKLTISQAMQFALGYTNNDYISNDIIHVNTGIPQLQSYKNNMRIPAYMDDGMANNIAQAISMINQDIAIYTILLQSLKYVQITQNPYELFSLINKLAPYVKISNKRY